ncbi:hypothetical protein [Lactococcus lactis]|uniref:hypothetical protein n=1 Tax=Lactococcus lactis TaxID=1358 RepID=UPI0022E78BE0|nr:hypothetical protein [Lactococcus lactis]
MKKDIIWKFLTIVVVVALMATGIYHVVGPTSSTDIYFYGSISMISTMLFDIALGLLLLLFSFNLVSSFRKLRFLNYISMLIGIAMIILNIYVSLTFWGYIPATKAYLQVIGVNQFLEKVIVGLLLISLLIFNQNKKETSDNPK